MPLVVLTGQPASGKSTVAARLRALLEPACTVVDEPSLHLERNAAYAGAPPAHPLDVCCVCVCVCVCVSNAALSRALEWEGRGCLPDGVPSRGTRDSLRQNTTAAAGSILALCLSPA